MTESQVVGAAVAVWLGAWWHPAVPRWAVGVAAVVAFALRSAGAPRAHAAVVIVALGAAGGSAGHAAMAGLVVPDHREIVGVATVWSDPVREPGGTAAVVRWRGLHLLASARGSGSGAMATVAAGERVWVEGRVRPLGPRTSWATARHLAARAELSEVIRLDGGLLPFRLANALRRTLVAGATSLSPGEAALYRGLVVGDDRDQTDVTAHRFRASGLGHLLAVSGQNVAFVLVAVQPLTDRLRLRGRWVATLGVLVLFALVTRWEPSVLRAVAMAAVVATASRLGRATSSRRVLAVAVITMVVVDPLIVRSLGFQLSVAASAALVELARPLARRLPGPDWVTGPLGVVLAAQVGTTPLLLAAGSTFSLASIPANLLAVPVAGWVMVWGLTAGVVAGLGPAELAAALHLPTRAMLWFVDSVASAAASPAWPRFGAWGCAGLAVVVAWWMASRRTRVLAASAVLVAAVTWWPAAPGARPVGPGVVAVREAGLAALVLDGRARVRTVLAAATDDCPELVVVTGGAARPRDAVHALAQVCPRPVIVAPREAGLDGAVGLTTGRLTYGALALDVTREGGRWAVKPAGAAESSSRVGAAESSSLPVPSGP